VRPEPKRQPAGVIDSWSMGIDRCRVSGVPPPVFGFSTHWSILFKVVVALNNRPKLVVGISVADGQGVVSVKGSTLRNLYGWNPR